MREMTFIWNLNSAELSRIRTYPKYSFNLNSIWIILDRIELNLMFGLESDGIFSESKLSKIRSDLNKLGLNSKLSSLKNYYFIFKYIKSTISFYIMELLKIIKFINIIKRLLFTKKIKRPSNWFFLSVYSCTSYIIINFVICQNFKWLFCLDYLTASNVISGKIVDWHKFKNISRTQNIRELFDN